MTIINHRSWIDPDLCDIIYLPEYDEGTPTIIPEDGSIVYCPLDHIVEFFDLIRDTDNKYVLISANSDYGLHLQETDPVERDMQKWLPMQDVTGIGYNPAVIPPRCNVERCKINDRFSVKMYSYTCDTFNDIPSNIVHWFSTNINIPSVSCSVPITRIPFGMGSNPLDIGYYRIDLKDKEDLVYMNWTNNTNERLEIKKVYKNHPMAHIVSNQSYEEYLTDMARCKFVMCPEGNGLDSYRIWEASYLGCIPIVHRDNWSEWMLDSIPVCIPNHRGVPSPDQLLEVYQQVLDSLNLYKEHNLEYAPMNTVLNYDWWKEFIKECRP